MILKAEAVTKRFDDRPVLSRASLTLEPGQIVHLAGPNGSGKTTLARILGTLLPPDEGEILVDDVPLSERRSQTRRMIGFASHAPLLYLSLTPVENLEFFARLAGARDGRRRALALLERFGLDHAAHRPLAHFSRGMLQRVVLCRALLLDPELLILDEPYAGLDDAGILVVNQVLSEIRKQGRTALLIAHDKERGGGVITRTVRLRNGRVEDA
ncbi:MAG TPA: heme ABC exporter ATP-binding protein CcmA [Candidatus Eisenbacteria bacterium]|nr:heme ABC exporter ATP-binding protein CcmA [Candidatus Eisenbacteria bacterium]